MGDARLDPRVPWDRLRVVDLADASIVRRHRAVAAHRSQVHPLSDDPRRGRRAPRPGGRARPGRRRARRRRRRDARDAAAGLLRRDVRARRDDPWGFEDRWYEGAEAEAVTLAALPAAHAGRVLEVGCSIGVLTAALAERTFHCWPSTSRSRGRASGSRPRTSAWRSATSPRASRTVRGTSSCCRGRVLPVPARTSSAPPAPLRALARARRHRRGRAHSGTPSPTTP